jgi:hypothetical protein
MAEVERLLARKDSHVRVDKNEIVLSPLEADPRPASAEALAACITEHLSRVDLSEVLMEVDTWTHFSRHFVHAADATALRPALLPIMHAMAYAVQVSHEVPPPGRAAGEGVEDAALDVRVSVHTENLPDIFQPPHVMLITFEGDGASTAVHVLLMRPGSLSRA